MQKQHALAFHHLESYPSANIYRNLEGKGAKVKKCVYFGLMKFMLGQILGVYSLLYVHV